MSNIITPLPKLPLGTPLNPFQETAKGLVYYWRGIPGGKAFDESGHGNDGTIVGATWAGDGLYFDGSNQYTQHDVGAGFIPALPYTVCIWVKAQDDNPASDQYFFYFGNSSSTSAWNSLNFNNTGKIVGWDRNSGAQVATVLDYADGQWHFVVVTFFDDGEGNVSVSVDGGIPVSTSAGGSILVETYNRIAFGMLRDDSPSGAFTGWVKDIKFYNRALSQSEISALYINPDLPMAQDPISLIFSQAAGGLSIPIAMHHYKQMQGAA